jgi:predicted amidophosphoribosyltransferase
MSGDNAGNIFGNNRRDGGGRLTHCVSCGASGYPDDRFCPCCGNAMIHTCPACGEEIAQPVAFYCTQCGAALNEIAT